MSFPKVIHQIWFDFENGIKMDDDHKQIMEMNTKHIIDNGYEYRLWNISSANDFIEKNYPFYVSFMRKRWTYDIIKCDFFRYLIMYHFGGLYIDLDFVLIKPLNEMFEQYTKYDVTLFEEWYNSANFENKSSIEGSLHNGCLLSKPRNEFWLKMINKLITNAPSIKTKESVWGMSGTNLLRNMYIKYDDVMIIHQPYYIMCPFKSVSKTEETEILCVNEEVIPCLQESSWKFFTIHDIIEKKEIFTKSYAVCVGVKNGSLWNR
jgi:mannosyltransferase OCH1-like enzyme